MSKAPTPSLIDLMSVSPGDGPDQYVGQTDAYGVIGVYGGHLVGQALAAGLNTVEEPKLAQSFHVYFVSPGNGERPIEYRVTRLREGRGSDLRNIQAWQDGRLVLQMTASFKLAEVSDEHQPQMPLVDDPEQLVLQAKNAAVQFSPPPTKDGRAEMVLASEHFLQPEYRPGRDAVLKVWMRCPQLLTNADRLSERQSQVLLAFLSDGPLMFNSVIPHGLPFQTHRLTSIDHAAWFHRPCDVSQWMLFDQHSSAAADGRGMNHGTIFSRDGRLLMTVAQESMLRRI